MPKEKFNKYLNLKFSSGYPSLTRTQETFFMFSVSGNYLSSSFILCQTSSILIISSHQSSRSESEPSQILRPSPNLLEWWRLSTCLFLSKFLVCRLLTLTARSRTSLHSMTSCRWPPLTPSLTWRSPLTMHWRVGNSVLRG